MRRAFAILSLVMLGACGDDGQSTKVESAEPVTSSTTSSTSTTTTAVASDELPGDRIEIFPHEGAALAVVGVAVDDELNVRTGPGVSFDVAFEVGPLATVVATGHNRSLQGAGIWSEIRDGNRSGWANSSFLLQPGQTSDVTSQVLAASSSRPHAETIRQLGRMVAEQRAGDSENATITIVDGPTVGDLAEITIDVIGFADDSVGGERLKIFAERDADGGFTLRSVEATVMCRRGVVKEGCL